MRKDQFTKQELTNRFLWMLDICERNNWIHLAALVEKQLTELQGR